MAPHLLPSRDASFPDRVPALLASRLAVAGPTPDFSTHLRGRLVAAATVRPAAREQPSTAAPGARRAVVVRLTVAAAGGAVVVAGLGVGTAHALPGQPLYGAKRDVESLQLGLRHGAAARGREQLGFARTRLGEVRALSQHHTLAAARGTTAGGSADARVAGTLRTMDDETRAGSRDLVIAAGRGDHSAAAALLAFTEAQAADLAAVRPDLPPAAAPAADASRALLEEVRGQAASLAATAGGPPTPTAASPAPVLAPPATRTPVATSASPISSGAPLPSTAAAPEPSADGSPPRSATPAPTETASPSSPEPSASPGLGSSTAPADAPPQAPVAAPPVLVGPIALAREAAFARSGRPRSSG